MTNLLNGKDSRWLQLEVCREYQRNKCSRPDTECKFAHPPANVEVQNGRVTACYDSIKTVRGFDRSAEYSVCAAYIDTRPAYNMGVTSDVGTVPEWVTRRQVDSNGYALHFLVCPVSAVFPGKEREPQRIVQHLVYGENSSVDSALLADVAFEQPPFGSSGNRTGAHTRNIRHRFIPLCLVLAIKYYFTGTSENHMGDLSTYENHACRGKGETTSLVSAKFRLAMAAESGEEMKGYVRKRGVETTLAICPETHTHEHTRFITKEPPLQRPEGDFGPAEKLCSHQEHLEPSRGRLQLSALLHFLATTTAADGNTSSRPPVPFPAILSRSAGQNSTFYYTAKKI
uniref:Uncharacterized protein n=1 Tax=Anopheles atroparvus TaxID=41427 RepID=A0A182IWJ1_ANOAO